jgi:hypothetical protein
MEKRNMLELRTKSGDVTSDDPLVVFLYRLMQNHLPVGTVEKLVEDCAYENDVSFRNGWLATYAKYLAAQLRAAKED